jgi:hypothetical protein
MDKFLTDVADALAEAGATTADHYKAAHRIVSEVETTLMRPEAFAARLQELSGRLGEVLCAAVGAPVGRLLITPVPDYVAAVLPEILSEFPAVVLADNYKAGTMIGGQPCITLDDALADQDGFDACLLGTVDQRLGRLFRDRLPESRTVGAADLCFADPKVKSRSVDPGLAAFEQRLRRSPRPLLVLAAYLDATVAPTWEALSQQGFDVFIVTRRAFSSADTHAITDPTTIDDERSRAVDFGEMLWLLGHTKGCPVVINYARFFASLWDMRNTIPLFAYSEAVLKATTGPRILQLYDAYQVCLTGLDVEAASFALYRRILELADGIIVNSGAAETLQELLGPGKPVIGFLRYGPDAEAQPEPDQGPFSIAMITSFLGEGNDPTRMTAEAVRALLRQGLHIHYYSSHLTARSFREQLPTDQASRFHIHAPIRGQSELVREISRYNAGWFVVDISCCEALGEQFETPFARALAGSFISTAVATAGILYGCAGLPTFFNPGNFGGRMFPEGCAIEIEFDDVARLRELIDARDWVAMRDSVYRSRESFSAPSNIGRLVAWLDQFYGPPTAT